MIGRDKAIMHIGLMTSLKHREVRLSASKYDRKPCEAYGRLQTHQAVPNKPGHSTDNQRMMSIGLLNSQMVIRSSSKAMPDNLMTF